MKTRAFVIILIFVLAVLANTGSSVSASDIEIFYQAVKSGDVAEIKRLIEKEVDVKAQTKKGDTALMWASEQEIVELLKRAGAEYH